ncbi:unnamed protein product [Chondrus crispus]|uniref:Uncharacterized protein n=1 Tax=Chondrus crispus TaxID=2769 RepID=R7Q5L1_CHOCR|nr:unnamed protein product [Chondrus crispus]CDF32661.1 unnamed protein product [Chondrus crispus]|eukprot:XP_005712432.1 unnamed protein product [Chondrus crispus]
MVLGNQTALCNPFATVIRMYCLLRVCLNLPGFALLARVCRSFINLLM